MRTTIVGLLITLLAAISGGAFAWWLAAPDTVPATDPTERALAAADGLRDSNVYIEPAARGFLNEHQIAQLDEAAAAADPEVFLVVWPWSLDAGYAISSDVLRQAGTQLGRPGVYVEVDPAGGLADAQVGIEGSLASFFDSGEETWTGQQATDQLLSLIRETDGGSYEAASTTIESGYWGGTGGAIGAGVFLGALCALGGSLIGIVAWFTVRARRTAAARGTASASRSSRGKGNR